MGLRTVTPHTIPSGSREAKSSTFAESRKMRLWPVSSATDGAGCSSANLRRLSVMGVDAVASPPVPAGGGADVQPVLGRGASCIVTAAPPWPCVWLCGGRRSKGARKARPPARHSAQSAAASARRGSIPYVGAFDSFENRDLASVSASVGQSSQLETVRGTGQRRWDSGGVGVHAPGGSKRRSRPRDRACAGMPHRANCPGAPPSSPWHQIAHAPGAREGDAAARRRRGQCFRAGGGARPRRVLRPG